MRSAGRLAASVCRPFRLAGERWHAAPRERSPHRTHPRRRHRKKVQVSPPLRCRLRSLRFDPPASSAGLRGRRADFTASHPITAALVIEIAVTSAAEDRSLASLYAEAGVEEYWIVLPVERRIEVHSCPQAGSYLDHAIVESDTILTCGTLPPSASASPNFSTNLLFPESLPIHGNPFIAT